MKKNYSWLFIALSILTAQGCAVSGLSPFFPASLVGTWTPEDPYPAPSRLTFSSDGSYQFDTDGNGTTDIEGPYAILFNRQVKFQYMAGNVSAECTEPAIYQFKKTSRGLKFYLLGDQCPMRVELLKKIWVRAERQTKYRS